VLREILSSAGLNAKVCADLMGLDHTLFHQWVMGQRPIPPYIVPELSSVLGVPKDAILTSSSGTGSSDNAPAIWFKFRAGDKLTDADREIVVLIRKLGHFMDELERLTESRYVTWKALFETVRKASPKEQGKIAAQVIRADRQLGFPLNTRQGIRGTGDIFRDNLRSIGVRIIETPVPPSQLEGCSFYVGAPGSERPCLFANTYKQTWFRRNSVLMHELAHAIFDIEGTAASLDFTGEPDKRQLEELRAQAFSLEVLVPREVLNHIARTSGMKWEALTNRDIAVLVAASQVEQGMVIKAALEAGFIDAALAEKYSTVEIHDHLKGLTERALTTQEFVKSRRIGEGELISAEFRTTTIPSRALRLPLPYVARVVNLAVQNEISTGKAAQMLMIEKDTFRERFGAAMQEATA
jgi:Zn-dependent peptidase ImmA (M78 family)